MRRIFGLGLLTAGLLLALGCNGPKGDMVGEILGQTSERVGYSLSPAEFAALPSLSNIDVEAPLTEADYVLWQDHAQVCLVKVIGPRVIGTDETAFNDLINNYRFNVGTIVADLKSGAQTPEDVLRFLSVIRSAVANDLGRTVLTGEAQTGFNEFWQQNAEVWARAGYPGGPTDLAAEAVREIGITPQQGAELIEIGVKLMIESSRVMNPDGAVTSDALQMDQEPGAEQQREFMAIGNKYWNQMMEVFDSSQRVKAFRWYNQMEAKMDAADIPGQRHHHPDTTSQDFAH